MKSKWLLLVVLGGLLIALDQLTKYWVNAHLQIGEHQSITSFFDLVHYRNPGAAFSLFADWDSKHRNWFFYSVSGAALTFLIYYFWQTSSSEKGILFSLIAIMGGAIGNLIDRFTRGSVVDFLFFHWKEHGWPSFNVADCAITVGVAGLLWASFRSFKAQKKLA